MSLDDQRKKIVDDALLDAMLEQAYTPFEKQELSWQELRDKLTLEQTLLTETKQNWGKLRWASGRGLSIAAAAVLLLVAGYFALLPSSNNAAYASVTRSLEAKLPSRHYRLTMKNQAPMWGERTIVCDLYFDDQDRFVMHHPGWRNGDVWIGGNSEERWIIPPMGPALIGGEEFVGKWLVRRGIPSQFLHLSTLLDRLRRRYRLRKFENVALAKANHETVDCEHIVGQLKWKRLESADRIELWSDTDTGIAQRLQLTWDRQTNDLGPKEWTLELMDDLSLSDDWFTMNGHLSEDRPVRKVRSDSEMRDSESEMRGVE